MKNLFALLIALISFSTLFSTPQFVNSAQEVAEFKLKIEDKNDYTIGDVFELKNDDGKNLSFVFSLNPQGFIAVSTDNEIAPIIAYSFRNNFVNEDIEQNIGYQMLKEDMKLRLVAIPYISDEIKKENNFLWEKYLGKDEEYFNNREREMWPPAGFTSTGGWVETQWNQNPTPYWDFCPRDPGTGARCYVGCVGTAFAQMINYHRFIGGLGFNDYDDYYSTGTNTPIVIDDDWEILDFPSFPQLNEYLDTLAAHYENGIDLTNEDISALSFAAGVSINMQYSSTEGSGTQTSYIVNALLNRFDYASAENYNISEPDFYTTLIEDMMNARPAIFSIFRSSDNAGHAIIADGYNSGDDSYHLNYGWAGNSDGWYYLPDGMPADFDILSHAIMEIEGGTVPFDLIGMVYADVSTAGAYITLNGVRDYEGYADEYGVFVMPYVHEGTYTATAIIELESGGYYYESKEVYLESTSFLEFNLGNFENITGTVTAPISPAGCRIDIYQNNEIVRTEVADSAGFFSLPGLLPNNYIAMASLQGNYFEMKDVSIALENQVIDFDLEEYSGNISLSYAEHPTGLYHLAPFTMSCGICLTEEEIDYLNDDVISKVRFKSPIGYDEGELYGQLWRENILVSEKQVTDFSKGEWIEVIFDRFIPTGMNTKYYVGYKITSTSGDLAYHDAGPRISGKGAFFKTGGWVELPSIYDFNFCIDAIIISQNYGSINGNVELLGGESSVCESVVKAQNFISHPNIDGDYSLDVKPETYNLYASLLDYSTDSYEEISVANGEIIENIDFTLVADDYILYGDVNGDDNVSSFDAALTLQYSAGLITDWTDDQIIAGDVNGDENISSYDAALILQYSAGLIDEFPVEGK